MKTPGSYMGSPDMLAVISSGLHNAFFSLYIYQCPPQSYQTP